MNITTDYVSHGVVIGKTPICQYGALQLTLVWALGFVSYHLIDTYKDQELGVFTNHKEAKLAFLHEMQRRQPQ